MPCFGQPRGPIRACIIAGLDEATAESEARSVGVARFGTPENIAAAVACLASAESGYVQAAPGSSLHARGQASRPADVKTPAGYHQTRELGL
ncbi:hypothetical protein [Roseicella aquatilis]|uniref:hypothetical protein n=1 Tax=Roseicella aquatilis TaxID=2527868 RepID=UPI00198128DB|nr:hypothetical protein [Roseicella aquatilis]